MPDEGASSSGNSWFYDFFASYQTLQIVKVKSLTLASIHHGFQLTIFTYIVVFVMMMKHGYQHEAPVTGNVQIKAKGMAVYNGKVHDAIDLVYPPDENGALFLMTRFLDTPKQQRGTCSSHSKKDSCSSDDDCPAGVPARSEMGSYTGKCDNGFCTLSAWCPTEDKTLDTSFLPEVENFTIFARSTVRFYNGHSTTNMVDDPTAPPVKKVHGLTPGQNLFTVGEIIQLAGSNYSEVAQFGATFVVSFKWDCNLDFGAHSCFPVIDVERLDDLKVKSPSSGMNFRYAFYWNDANSKSTRNLRKAFGIRILFVNTGIGRGFDAATLAIKLGAALALLKMATLAADYLAMQCLPKKMWYKSVMSVQYDDRDFVGEPPTEKSGLVDKERGAKGSSPDDYVAYGTTGTKS